MSLQHTLTDLNIVDNDGSSSKEVLQINYFGNQNVLHVNVSSSTQETYTMNVMGQTRYGKLHVM